MYGKAGMIYLQLGQLEPKLQIYKELIACPTKEEFQKVYEEGNKVDDYKKIYELEPNIYIRMYH